AVDRSHARQAPVLCGLGQAAIYIFQLGHNTPVQLQAKGPLTRVPQAPLDEPRNIIGGQARIMIPLEEEFPGHFSCTGALGHAVFRNHNNKTTNTQARHGRKCSFWFSSACWVYFVATFLLFTMRTAGVEINNRYGSRAARLAISIAASAASNPLFPDFAPAR